MTNVNQKVPDELWKAFKVCSALQGIKLKDALNQAIQEYIDSHKTSQIHIDFKVVQNQKKNLLTFVYEEELKNLLEEIVAAKKRNAPKQYMEELKDRMLKIVKKHPTIPKDLAEEVLATFKAIT